MVDRINRKQGNRHFRQLYGAAIASATGMALCSQAHAALVFTAFDLGTLGGNNTLLDGQGLSGAGGQLNSTGQVTGSSQVGTVYHGFSTGANGSPLRDLGSLGGTGTSSFITHAYGINDSGEATGASYIPGNANYDAFRTSSNTAINSATDGLGSLAAGMNSIGVAINSAGQVAGFGYTTSTSIFNAFRTTSSGGVSGSGLGTISLLANSTSAAYGINSAGTAVGVSSVNVSGANQGHAFRITSAETGLTTADDLGLLPGGTSSLASGINASGQTVGTATTTDTTKGAAGAHAFRTSATGTLTSEGLADDLGNLGGTAASIAYSINTQGQAVGYSYTAGNAAQHAFFVDTTGSLIDLNSVGEVTGLTPGYTLTKAYSINDSSQIAAIGTSGAFTHTFLLSPVSVPEPAALSLAVAGASIMLGRRRRR